MPQACRGHNVNHLLTLTTPTREQVLTTLARFLLRNACKSSEGALLFTDGTSDDRLRGAAYHEPERIDHAVPLLEPPA